jgi:hypothetical protein
MSAHEDMEEIRPDQKLSRRGGSYWDSRSDLTPSPRLRRELRSRDPYRGSSRNGRARSPRRTSRYSSSPSRTPPRRHTVRSHREPASYRSTRIKKYGRASRRRGTYSPPREQYSPHRRPREKTPRLDSPSPSPSYSKHRRRKQMDGSTRYYRKSKPYRDEVIGESRREITPPRFRALSRRSSRRESRASPSRRNQKVSPTRSRRRSRRSSMHRQSLKQAGSSNWAKKERMRSRSASGARLFDRYDRSRHGGRSLRKDRAQRDGFPPYIEDSESLMPPKDNRASRHRRKKLSSINGGVPRSRQGKSGMESRYREENRPSHSRLGIDPPRHGARRGSARYGVVSSRSKSPSPSMPDLDESDIKYLKGEISRQESTMNALRARIQLLYTERDELEVSAQYMRTIEKELAREKQLFNNLVKSMNETKAKALEIQELSSSC